MVDPMYRQIAHDLRRQIESGELPRGAQLPTELELRDEYEASRNTIRDAVKWLITRGLVETRSGQGRFVVERIIPFVTTLTGDPTTASGGKAPPSSSGPRRAARPILITTGQLPRAAGSQKPASRRWRSSKPPPGWPVNWRSRRTHRW